MKLCKKCKQEHQDDDEEAIPNNWKQLARPEQLEPIDRPWDTWLILAGRGFGKTRTGAETVWNWIQTNRYKRIAFVGQTIIEARQVMV